MLAIACRSRVRHERSLRELSEVQKAASLRSGARGIDARETLIADEKVFAESTRLLEQADAEITKEIIEDGTKATVDLQAELRIQLESMQLSDIKARVLRPTVKNPAK